MRVVRSLCLLVMALLALSLPAFGAQPMAIPGSAKGVLKVEKETIPIRYAAVDVSPGDLILVLTDNPMPPARVPFGIYAMTQEGKIRGMAITIDRATKKMTDGNLHHMAWGGQLGGLDQNSVLEIHRLDSDVLEGRVSTKAPVTFDGKTYSFDVTFSVALAPKELPKVSVSGSSSHAAKAYVEYYTALFSGDLPKAKALIVKTEQKTFDLPPSVNLSGFIRATRPSAITISSSSPTAKEEALTVTGPLPDGQLTTGSIVMVLEDGQWKVKQDKWKAAK
jgi:hypothetical protein